ncbi:uncharacterized protein BO96DRAFT_407248 [Aspergillus niger CBS 101883]|uniref:uncharacterized protein n=1 Tax=Aspergillus lacticoffeatus (strain CBS 101883) TaxID=1450533 RepID=UPI000D7F3C04|nr:uncharacterized protein BO96DRAFT_407248 [Aspergillus niger CBS 101883]PYH62630.1 hypothetical protein BO96DRAFT_407248 [Aspergillus niger CBS 101883]
MLAQQLLKRLWEVLYWTSHCLLTLASGLATAVSARFRSEALAGQAPSSFLICSQCKRQNMTPMWCECRIRLAKRKPYKV